MLFRAADRYHVVQAIALAMEPDEGRRAAMGPHFDAPSAKSLAYDIGIHDQIQGCEAGACIMSRISDAMLLIGDTDKALEYSTEVSVTWRHKGYMGD